jgi:hypothetical protein
MPEKPQSAGLPDLRGMVEKFLPRLRTLSLSLDTYGRGDDAQDLSEIIGQLQTAVPACSPSSNAMDFIVNATFRVTRLQVAKLLSCRFNTATNAWYKILEYRRPEAFRFRADRDFVFREVDYPLNEGGGLGIARKEPASEIVQLDLSSISDGLSVMASHYPRHFVDLLNEQADEITADAFLQCCLFGELIYG